MIMTRMKHIIGSIILNLCSGKERLLSEAILDLVLIYTYCSGENSNDDVSKRLDAMLEIRGKSQAA